MKQRGMQSSQIYALALFGLVLFTLLSLVSVGTNVYRVTQLQKNADSDKRGALSYLVTQVRAADMQGGVQVDQNEAGAVLILSENGGEYATRIYLSDGWLMEDYSAADAALSPQTAQPIAATDTFSAEWEADNLLRVTTVQGSALVALRSGGGAALA